MFLPKLVHWRISVYLKVQKNHNGFFNLAKIGDFFLALFGDFNSSVFGHFNPTLTLPI